MKTSQEFSGNDQSLAQAVGNMRGTMPNDLRNSKASVSALSRDSKQDANGLMNDQYKKLSGIENLLKHLKEFGHTNCEREIEGSYSAIQALLNQMEQLQTAMLQKHELDFIAAYKDHMLKVQFELIQFTKRSTEFYQSVKRNEKIKNLQDTVDFLRAESQKLSQKTEQLQNRNKTLETDLKRMTADAEHWHNCCQITKHQNTVLQKAVKDLKNPALIQKYEQNGARKAEQQLQNMIEQHSRNLIETQGLSALAEENRASTSEVNFYAAGGHKAATAAVQQNGGLLQRGQTAVDSNRRLAMNQTLSNLREGMDVNYGGRLQSGNTTDLNGSLNNRTALVKPSSAHISRRRRGQPGVQGTLKNQSQDLRVYLNNQQSKGNMQSMTVIQQQINAGNANTGAINQDLNNVGAPGKITFSHSGSNLSRQFAGATAGSANQRTLMIRQAIQNLVSQCEDKILEIVEENNISDDVRQQIKMEMLNQAHSIQKAVIGQSAYHAPSAVTEFGKDRQTQASEGDEGSRKRQRNRSGTSGSPKSNNIQLLQKEGFFAPQKSGILPQEAIQEIFIETIESALNWQKKQEKLKHLKREQSPKSGSGVQSQISPKSSRPVSPQQQTISPKAFFRQLVEKSTEEDKTQALIKFLSKPAVMHSLYDLMFLDRRNHRAGDSLPGDRPLIMNQFANQEGAEGAHYVDDILRSNGAYTGLMDENLNIIAGDAIINASGTAGGINTLDSDKTLSQMRSSYTNPLAVANEQLRRGVSQEVLLGQNRDVMAAVNSYSIRNRQVAKEMESPMLHCYIAPAGYQPGQIGQHQQHQQQQQLQQQQNLTQLQTRTARQPSANQMKKSGGVVQSILPHRPPKSGVRANSSYRVDKGKLMLPKSFNGQVE